MNTPPEPYAGWPKRNRRAALIQLAAFVAVVGALIAFSMLRSPNTSGITQDGSPIDRGGCVINGYGNKLCGEDARSLCELQWQSNTLDPGNSYDACESVGWTESAL